MHIWIIKEKWKKTEKKKENKFFDDAQCDFFVSWLAFAKTLRFLNQRHLMI
jgi:hypothetical protein